MKQSPWKIWGIYVALILIIGAFSLVFFQTGKELNISHISTNQNITQSLDPSSHGWFGFVFSLIDKVNEPSAILLLQIISILVFARIFGWFFSKMGQPTVIGEILAGIILGPSILGHFFPHVFLFVFKPDSLNNLYILSQLGLILFMFTIGMDLNLKTLKDRFAETWLISHASIFIPFLGGIIIAYPLYREFAGEATSFLNFALFMGISMSITAFPVLARIVQEKGYSKTHLGNMSLGIAAIGDVTAWCMLAGIIAIAKTGSMTDALYTIGLSAAYIGFMFLILKPFLQKIGTIYGNAEVMSKSIVAFFLLILVCSSLITHIIGIHALFGAFLAGVIMPSLPNFRKLLIDKIEDISVTLLLPLFFVFTGLRTEIGLLNTVHLWGVCCLIIVIAIIGKFGGTALTARLMGESVRNSLSMGILMNTRGLMELIVLNIGYEMGILSPSMFVMLVIMALFTTFMTTPAISLIDKIYPLRNIIEERDRQKALGIFKALVACGNPENGKNLLHVAKTVLDGSKNSLAVSVLHITAGTDLNPLHSEDYSKESFKGVIEEANRLNIPIDTKYKVTDNISHEIVHTVNQEDFDFLLVGAGVSLPKKGLFHKEFFYPGSLIKDKTRYFIENSQCSVGVFINRNFNKISKTAVLIEKPEDEFLLRYARRLIRNNKEVKIFIMDPNNLSEKNSDITQKIELLKNEFPTAVKVAKNLHLRSGSLPGFSLFLLSYNTWNLHIARNEKNLENIPSTLIVNKKTSRFHA